MKKRIITLTGLPGSGKSSAANAVAKELGYGRVSSGDFMRAIAKSRGISNDDLNQLAIHDKSIDAEVDDMVKASGEKEGLVIDSRLAFHWIPTSFKVFLKIDPRVAAERTFNHIQEVGRISQTASSVEDVYEKTKARIESECKRYQTYYRVNYQDETQFDLVLDTTSIPLDKVVQTVVSRYNEWLAS